jgi:hypothetical protein
MSDRTAARFAMWLGAGAIIVLLSLNIINATVAGGCARPFSIFQFQLGGFDAAKGELMGLCGLERSNAAHWVNIVDVALFIPLYAAFLMFSARVLSGRWIGPVTLLAIAAALGAAAFDWRETLAQLAVTSWTRAHHGGDFETQRATMEIVLQAARLKYAFFAANAAFLALICFLRTPRLPIIGGIVLLPIAGASAVVNNPEEAWMVALTFGASWLTLIVYARRRARLLGKVAAAQAAVALSATQAKDAPPSSPEA